ncbi:MAG: transposase [Acidobacteriota bacterium]|nr:transposase [Acidobacteriota bacterium]
MRKTNAPMYSAVKKPAIAFWKLSRRPWRFWSADRRGSASVAFSQRGVVLGHYQLRAWVIMANHVRVLLNHVHVLFLPLISASRLLQSLKGYTARQANLLLGRTGQKFWQAESYDHWVRDDKEMERISAYIENNPVKAGLVDCAACTVGRVQARASRRFSTQQTRVSAPRKHRRTPR